MMKFLHPLKVAHRSERPLHGKDITKSEDKAFTNAKKIMRVIDSAEPWEEIKDLIVPDAPFTCQAHALSDVSTIHGWYDWMLNFKTNIAPDGTFTVRSIMWDEKTKVCMYSAVYHATHTGEGGAIRPTNKHADTDYFYQLTMNDDGKAGENRS